MSRTSLPSAVESTCGSSEHVSRRALLRAAGVGGCCWLTAAAHRLAWAAEQASPRETARSIIMLWMGGGPSQLDTFDPHPGTKIGGDVRAIETPVQGVQLAENLSALAGWMPHAAIVRNLVTKEGDHERGTYNVKTGYRPVPGFVHPAVGAVACHELPEEFAPGRKTEVPRHVSILPGAWPGRGGYLGDRFDAFQMFDPRDPVPDVSRRVSPDRFGRRLADLDVVEREFAGRRSPEMVEKLRSKTLHQTMVENALRMMDSEQLAAFDVNKTSPSLRSKFGDTPFGRGCLAAVQLVGVGVRCVEVTLDGWDTHANNEALQSSKAKLLDQALSALLAELKERDLLRATVVMCGGEFGRTPQINPLGGRDHWPHGFSMFLCGGGVRGGQVIGQTDPEGGKLDHPSDDAPKRPGTPIDDLHASVLAALGIDPAKDTSLLTPDGRAMQLSKGRPIARLLS